MGCGLLVPHVDDAHAFVPAALVDRHDVPAGECEDDVHTFGGDRPGREPAALDALGHGVESRPLGLRLRA
jgi:hypothetical protein